MLPENYCPRAGDMFRRGETIFVFVNAGVNELQVLYFEDRYQDSCDKERNLTISSFPPRKAGDVFTFDQIHTKFLGHVDFGKIAEGLLNGT